MNLVIGYLFLYLILYYGGQYIIPAVYNKIAQMIHRPLNSSVLLPHENILSNSFASSNSDHKYEKQKTENQNSKLNQPSKDKKSKILVDSSLALRESQIEGVNSNEDTCFRCKKVGELYCCENCFRSFHWKCIGPKKLEELTKMTHVMNFICESCDSQNICTKCNSVYPKNKFDLIDYSDHNSVLSFLKCTHCYSKIHKKCFDVPYEALEKSFGELREYDGLPHYFCVKCLENVGITEVVMNQRMIHNSGGEKLYFCVLLNTNSPIHKGWFEEITLHQHMKKFSENQTFINDFLNDKSLYQFPEIEKIIQIRLPSKHKSISISDVLKIIESRSRISNLERYGNPQNFKFLVKWKNRDYTCLTWQDQTIIIKNLLELKRFLAQRQKLNCIIYHIQQYKDNKKNQNHVQLSNYKVLQYYLTTKQQIKLKYLHVNRQIDPFNRLDFKSFEERMQNLDTQNAKEPFAEIIEIDFHKASLKSPYEYIEKLVLYFQKCYLTEIILRPILIITDEVDEWQEALKNLKKFKERNLRYTKFFGGKENTNSIKKWDFFASFHPCITKFDILLLDYNYFRYEKEYLFGKIPNFLIVVFDKSQHYSCETQKLKFIQQNYLHIKSKVQKEIYLLENASTNNTIHEFAQNLMKLTELTATPIKKSIFHTLDFSKFIRFNSSEPKLKIIIDKKFKECSSIFDLNSKQLFKEGQRLSLLKFIMSYGLNIKTIDEMCIRLKEMNPQIWKFQQKDMGKMKDIIKTYISMFMSVISRRSQEITKKMDYAASNYFLFSYQSEAVLKRIIQLKKLKTQVEICLDDRTKFPIMKHFKFFFSGQFKYFPLWNIYEDYTLGALIVEEGYQRWDQIINSKKWTLYHEELETLKRYHFNQKSSTFEVQEQIVPIKKKCAIQNSTFEGIQTVRDGMNGEQKRSQYSSSNKSEEKQLSESKIVTYGDYLINKIKNSKEFKEMEIEYEKLLDVNVLQVHIAERGDDILSAME